MQDLSGSFSDDIANVRALWPSVVAELQASYDVHFGVISYVDLPFGDFGYSGEWPYRLESALDADSAKSQAAINAFSIQNGNDWWESQLWALYEGVDDDAVGWREDSMKVMLLATDAAYHVEGDASAYASTIRSYYPATGLSDYPSVAALRAALESKNVLPIFAVTQASFTYYMELAESLGLEDVVVDLDSNSANLLDVVHQAMIDACQTVRLSPVEDPDHRVTVHPSNAFVGTEYSKYAMHATVDTSGLTEDYVAVLGAVDGASSEIRVAPYSAAPSALPTGSPTASDEAAIAADAAAVAADAGLALASCVVGGWPHDGTVFTPALEITVPFDEPADVVKVLWKASLDAEWVELDASAWTQPHAFAATLTTGELGYFALLVAVDDATGGAGNLTFSASGGVINGGTTLPTVSK